MSLLLRRRAGGAAGHFFGGSTQRILPGVVHGARTFASTGSIVYPTGPKIDTEERESSIVEPKAITIEKARAQPIDVYEMSGEALFLMAEDGHLAACEERLIRNVMAVDEVEWPIAHAKVQKMKAFNQQSLGWYTIPHQVGMFTGMMCGTLSIPLVFSWATAKWFNERYVTMDIPPAEDLETMLEVGSWTWGWMEPIMGTGTFVLLGCQFARNQMLNMSIQPYTGWIQRFRAKRLLDAYPTYNDNIVEDFARSSKLTPPWAKSGPEHIPT